MNLKMSPLINYTEQVDISGYDVVIPSVSVGNVPQLVVDLLVTSYKLRKVGNIWHPAIVPCVGIDTFSPDNQGICTACELYINEEFKLAVIQLRSTLESRIALKFFQDLKEELLKSQPKTVFVLSSAFDYELHNLTLEKFYYLSEPYLESLEGVQVRQLQKDVTGRYYLNGSGFGLKLFETLQPDLPCVLLGKYVSEGDNRPDAFSVFDKISSIRSMVGIEKPEIIYPSSWKFAFGGPPPVGLF